MMFRVDLFQRYPIPHHATKAKAFCIEALTNLGMCAKNLCLEAIGSPDSTRQRITATNYPMSGQFQKEEFHVWTAFSRKKIT